MIGLYDRETKSASPRRGAFQLIGALALCLWMVTGAALAQAPGHVTTPGDEVPPLPKGDGLLRGQVVHPSGPGEAANLPIALYALQPDGSPGIGQTQTDAEGRFRFEDISSAAGVIYLLGTRYAEVPFGHRFAFEDGQREVDVVIELDELTTDAAEIAVVRSVIALDWVGSQLLVQESHHLLNTGEQVVFVPEAQRSGHMPALRAQLPPDHSEFNDGQNGLGGGLVRDGDALSYWGPVYPGPQEVRYRYLLSAEDTLAAGDAAKSGLSWTARFPSGTGSVQVLTAQNGPGLTAAGLVARDEPVQIDASSYQAWEGGALPAGGSLDLAISLPESSTDTSALRIARADFWIDHDDAAMRVTADYQLHVDGDTNIVAPEGEALVHLPMPEGAEFLGLSGAAAALGVAPAAGGGLEIRGPLPPGTSAFGYKYRAPADAAGISHLDLHFGRPVDLLNLLVADNGVIVESERLHRRRPFRQGTRTYLHNEAYQVSPAEHVAIQLRPLDRDAMPQAVAIAGGLVLAALSALFLIAPLRETRDAGQVPAPPPSTLGWERENIYESIRDLQHDFDTGKIEAADYERMKSELRADAVALLRQQRAKEEAEADVSAEPAPAPGGATAGKAAFCTQCGERLQADWRFCAGCGQAMPADSGPAA